MSTEVRRREVETEIEQLGAAIAAAGADAPVDLLTRIKLQSKFHRMSGKQILSSWKLLNVSLRKVGRRNEVLVGSSLTLVL